MKRTNASADKWAPEMFTEDSTNRRSRSSTDQRLLQASADRQFFFGEVRQAGDGLPQVESRAARFTG